MKKVIVIALVSLFFLVLVSLVVYKLFLPNTSTSYTPSTANFPTVTPTNGSTDQDPSIFLRSFYEWYLRNFANDPLFPRTENRDEVLSPWLTKQFLSQWDQIQQESESNPVLITSEDSGTWGTAISVIITEQSVRTRTALVSLGSGEKIHKYTVSLIKDFQGTGWKINSIVNAP